MLLVRKDVRESHVRESQAAQKPVCIAGPRMFHLINASVFCIKQDIKNQIELGAML